MSVCLPCFQDKGQTPRRAGGPPQAPVLRPSSLCPVHHCVRRKSAMAPRSHPAVHTLCDPLAWLWAGPVHRMGLSFSSLRYLRLSQQNKDREILRRFLKKQAAVLWRGPHDRGRQGAFRSRQRPPADRRQERGGLGAAMQRPKLHQQPGSLGRGLQASDEFAAAASTWVLAW